MIAFLVVAAVLLAAGAGALLWPLLRGATDREAARTGAVVALFRDQLRELEAEHRAGTVEEPQYAEGRREIERNLIDALAAVPQAPAGPRRARWSAVGVGALVLLAPVALYAVIGTPEALLPGAEVAEAGTPQPLTSAQVQKMTEGLVARLKAEPGNVEGWMMLGRAYSYQRQYADAVRAFTQAVALEPKNPRLLADLADAMAMVNGRRLDGMPLKLVERALQLDPKEVKALALAGSAAFDRRDYAKAIDYWQRALATHPADPELVSNLRNGLDEARQAAAGGAPAPSAVAAAPDGAAAAGGRVHGKVSLSPALAAKTAPEDTVFVFARAAQGPRIPLALMRRQVKDLPFDFALDDSMAMVPEYSLSKYSPVIVGARISHSGDALAAAGDLQGFSKPVAVGGAVSVVIDQVVR